MFRGSGRRNALFFQPPEAHELLGHLNLLALLLLLDELLSPEVGQHHVAHRGVLLGLHVSLFLTIRKFRPAATPAGRRPPMAGSSGDAGPRRPTTAPGAGGRAAPLSVSASSSVWASAAASGTTSICAGISVVEPCFFFFFL